MVKPGRPGDGQSNPSQGQSQSTPGSTPRTGKLQKVLTKARQLVRRLALYPGPRKNGPENTSTIDNKDSQLTSDELAPQRQPQIDTSIQDEHVRKDDHVTSTDTIDRPKAEDLKHAISQAEKDVSTIKLIPGVVNNGANTGAQANNVLQSIDNIDSTYLQPFKVFNTVVTEIANVHPYAKIALAGLSWASQIILNQASRDKEVLKLIATMSEIYEFLIGDGELDRIREMVDVLAPMSKQIMECAQFLDKYSETKGFWTRLGKNVVSETDTTIQKYNDALGLLMQKFRDHAARNTLVATQDTLAHVYRILEDLDQLGQDVRLDGMTYAAGAGINSAKTCLAGTRLEILGEITEWINSGDSERIFWLSGVAGSGKSAISHTVGRWLQDVGRLGSFFCFDRNSNGDRRHEKLFSTIARDLADCSVGLRHVVAEAVSTNASLKNTVDVLRQWRKFVLEPVLKSPTIGPVIIVIDALDESGPENSREQILEVLGDELAELPSNFRVLLTSRPLPDIHDALHGKAHVRAKTMDSINPKSTERDIIYYISHRLHNLHDKFSEQDFVELAQKADGLFEWARLACEFIRSRARGGYSPQDRFELLIASSDPEGVSLLDHMYSTILHEAIHQSLKARGRFQSTMRQILGTLEPLSMTSLNEMRQLFPKNEDRFKVELILESMAPLLSGITDPTTSVRPLHASFHDFLTDKNRSKEFFVDLIKNETHRDLAFASLGVMKAELRFNMCGLETSYLRNIDVPNLPQRIKDNISPHLSYSCRFWSTHAHDAAFDARLREEIFSFVRRECLVFWFEALSLLGGISGAHDALESGMSPIEGHEEYSDTLAIARDAQRFIRVFGGPISQSAPHLYLSALPFAPKNSVFASSVASKLTRIPRVVVGRDEDWPSVQLLLTGHSEGVNSVALSPDGKWIASGSDDDTIRIWDIETGSLVGHPLRGHTGWVRFVAFLPNGHKIVSGSTDQTVRIWDIQSLASSQTGIPLEGHRDTVNSIAISPNGKLIASGSSDKTIIVWDAEACSRVGCLEGHEESVFSVAFSPDGTRIVSGSYDCTVRVWDVTTHQQVGAPFIGHQSSVMSVAWSQDGMLIASGSYDRTIRFWNPDTGSQLGSPLQGHEGGIISVMFFFDSKHLVSGSYDSTVRVWDIAARSQVGSPLAQHTGWVCSVAISRDASRIVSGSWDRTVRVWDMRSSSKLGSTLDGDLSPILSVALLEDIKQVISASGSGTIQIWDVLTGAPVGSPLKVQSTWVSKAAFSVARKWVILGLDDHCIQVWSTETRSQVGNTFRGHDGAIRSVAISYDGKTIVSGSEDKTIRLWSTETWLPIGEPLKHAFSVRSAAFLPDDRTIVLGSGDGTVRLWDIDSGSPLGTLLAGRTSTGSPSKNPLQGAGHRDFVMSVASSRDGKYVALGAVDQSVRLWDVTKGSCLGELEGHESCIYSVAFSPTSEYIVSGSYDGTIRIWDTATLSQVGSPLVGHTRRVRSLAFSPDGEWIVSGSEDGTVRVWNFEMALKVARPLAIRAQAASPSLISPPASGTLMSDVHSLDSDSDDLRAPERSRCYIRLSHVLSHALGLQASPSIIGDTDRRDPTKADDEGWVMGPNRCRILWVPAHWREHLRFYDRSLVNTMTMPGRLELDLHEMAHGKTWRECWNA